MTTPPRTRLYVDAPLAEGLSIACDEKRAHYLLHVLRLQTGNEVVLFNGKEGEWLATLEPAGKKKASLQVQTSLRAQAPCPDLWLLCTPLKNGRTDWVIEKATELGVSRILPITTRFTAIDKTNTQRLHSIAIEAAEQCERMDVPAVEDITRLDKLLGNWPANRILLYGDESGGGQPPHALTPPLTESAHAVLVGPEGGFTKDEFALLRNLPFTRAVTLGPRILRADTAALAMITLIQSITGDWQNKPAFRSHEEHR